MRFCLAATLVALGIACATRDAGLVKTQVVTFPQGALVQYKGHTLGRPPVDIVLPQDNSGRLTERVEITALPNTAQTTLYAQTRTLDPSNRVDRVPDRIMIDMTLRGTNIPRAAAPATARVETAARPSASRARKVERSKPTDAVGLDRWTPGIY